MSNCYGSKSRRRAAEMGTLAVISDLHVDINQYLIPICSWSLIICSKIRWPICIWQEMWRIKTTAIRRGRIFQSRQVPTTFTGAIMKGGLDGTRDRGFRWSPFLIFRCIAYQKNTAVGNQWLVWLPIFWSDQWRWDLAAENLFWYDRMIQRKGSDKEISKPSMSV